MLRYQSVAVHARLERSEAALHVIGRRQRVSDLPEHSHLRKRRGDYAHEAASDPRRIQRFGIWAEHTPEDGPQSFRLPLIGVENMTVDERTRGLGGLQASVGEENLVYNDLDPRYRGRDVLTHELAHTLMDYGLPKAARRAIEQTYEASVVKSGLWRRPDGSKAYAATNPSEYFAELSMWLFGSHGEWVDRKRQLPAPGAAGLARYDPRGFALVGAIFDGTHTALQGDELEAPPQRILPVEASAFTAPFVPEAVEEEEEEVVEDLEEEEVGESTLHVKNTLRIDVAISWVDTNGDVVPYGKVPAGGIIAQRTYPGHVWEVCLGEHDHEQSAPVGRVLRYRASRHGSQLIEVGEAELSQSAVADNTMGV